MKWTDILYWKDEIWKDFSFHSIFHFNKDLEMKEIESKEKSSKEAPIKKLHTQENIKLNLAIGWFHLNLFRESKMVKVAEYKFHESSSRKFTKLGRKNNRRRINGSLDWKESGTRNNRF